MYNLIKLNEDKNIHIVNKINEFKSPKSIFIPILNNSTFKLNEYVYKKTYFGDYIASVSGYVTGLKKIKLNNKEVSAIEIKNDYKEDYKKKIKLKKPKNKEELCESLKYYNQTSILNKINNQTIINNLIVSSIDEEIYSVKEFVTLSNNYEEILETIDFLNDLFETQKSIIANKSTNFKSIKNVNSILGMYPNIENILVPNKFLISYKPFLCSYLNVLESETLVLTTTEILEIYRNIIKNEDVEDTIITISGNAIKKSQIIKTKLYVSLKELLDEYIKLEETEYNVYINGYVKGKKADNIEDVIITKNIECIVINKKEELIETDCINCGACAKICPKAINVKRCYFNNLKNNNCISCGLCNYICPSNLKLREIVEGNNEKI